MVTTMREQRLGRRRNNDGDDLVFLGNNQPWSDAFVGEGGLDGFYDDDANEDDNNGNNDWGDHRQLLGQQRNNDGDDLVFLGNNQPWSDAFLAEGWWVIFMMMTKMRMTTMVTTMRRTIALASFRRCYQCSQWQCRQ